MNPPPSKHKLSISGFLSGKWKAFRRSPSPGPSTSHTPFRAQSAGSPSPSSSTIDRLNRSPRSGSAVVLDHQSVVAPQALASPPLPAFSLNTSNSEVLRNVPPAIVVSDEAADPPITNKNQINPPTPIDPDSHAGQRATSGIRMRLRTALRVLHENARVFPPLQSAIGVFVDCLDDLNDGAKNRQEYEDLVSELTDLSKLLAQHMKQSSSAQMSNSIANAAHSIKEQANLIKNKQARRSTRGLIETNADLEDLERHYRQIGALFRQIGADANLSIWNIANDQMANARLEGLMPVKLANYDSKLSDGISRRTCTANTRTAILSGLNDWSNNPEAPDLYWMNGMAGTGKTTIACSFSESLEAHKQLAASFFCTRTVPECREATRIIPTIAFQLARYSVPFHSALCESLSQDPDVGAKNMTKQFERLLKTPLQKVKEAISNNLVVVIDALDECSDMQEVELLLSILLKSIEKIPLKFFVTSRPEPEICRRMLARSPSANGVLHLHDVEKSLVGADIEVYLSEELKFMSPTPKQIKQLAARSGNLFIYAATLVRYIRPGKGSRDPHKRLHSALAITSPSSKLHAAIDQLYTAVLEAAIGAEGLEDEEVADMRVVLCTVVCVQEPVDINTLAALTGLDDAQRILTALDALRSVVHFSESNGLVSTLHASFSDFMFDKARSNSFRCNLHSQSELLVRRCFKIMKVQLRFNICKLESSFIPDSKVENLKERVKQAVPPGLWYACRYWGDHLQHSTYSTPLCTILGEFLSVRLLFWMEVLNLQREMQLGAGIMLNAKLWLPMDNVPDEITMQVEDSRNFVTSFAANPVTQCTPHIYLSSLPFCSKSSCVFKQYIKNMQGIINVTGSAMQKRELAPLASWSTESPVLSAEYSPDSSHIAVGCVDGTVSVRSAYDGALVVGPLQGHTNWTYSVDYSPDGTRIASGSWDNTVRVWSAHTGTLVAGPIQGHTDSVMSVGYSPDGSHIVSGSKDRTIRVWSAEDGRPVAGPFEGHTGQVLSVEYSPDGTRIVSGSEDKTIRVWSADDGTPLAGPFKGHTGAIWSVGYSPDGTRIVSGSEDETVRVWSADDGTLLAGPFEGHTDWIWSVGYSPDGKRIVSSSDDRTIRVWNPDDGTLVAGPFQGHTNGVVSVAYSPDGSGIVSGSSDNTIRVWSPHNSALLAGPPQEKFNWVFPVGYSPDGTHIVSAYSDHTVRVWSARDGAPVVGPFQGHTAAIMSVGYSPDGSHIVSGSNDNTIRVCSARDGSPIAGPFQGHTDSVLSVGYSPDGSHIVSGSADETIRVWGAHTGTLLAGPFQGHTGSIWSVGYSPDGSHIVSGSKDRTIRVWSAEDGTLLAGPFEGHTDRIWSVGYSPDGTRIVSGSEDKTIRVWSADDGTLLAGPIQGHTDPVQSVVYSPDGTRIVSGSADQTIRVWSAHDGILVAGPFQGHTGPVWSVGYSPDGKYIVSGSVDETIRVWSVHSSAPVTGIFDGHTVSAPPSANPPSATSADSNLNHPTTTHISSLSTHDRTREPNSALAHWAVRKDGWVVNKHSQLLFWVPFELASYLPATHELLVIHPDEAFQIDHDDMLLGELWHQCYKPQ